MIQKPLVIYHGPGCLDGMAAAWAAYQHFGDNAEYIVGRYQSDEPIDFADRDVFMVDFSYKRQFLLENILPFANNVFMIDHHKTAIEELWDVPASIDSFHMCNSRIENSGAFLALEWFGGKDARIPKVLQHIQDRDLWQFKMEHTKEITAALFAKEELDYISIGKYMTDGHQMYQKLLAEGRTLCKAHDKEVNVLMKIARRTVMLHYGQFDPEGNYDGEDCIVIDLVNAPPKYSSDIGNLIAQENQFGGTYYDTATHREFSLRSIGDFDVSAIAKSFGGGGHKNAAGFKVPRSHPFARL